MDAAGVVPMTALWQLSDLAQDPSELHQSVAAEEDLEVSFDTDDRVEGVLEVFIAEVREDKSVWRAGHSGQACA